MENWRILVQAWFMQSVDSYADVQAVLQQVPAEELEIQPHTRMRDARHYAEVYRFRRDEIGLSDADCPGLSASIDWLDALNDTPVQALSVKAQTVSALLFANQHAQVCAGFLLKREPPTADAQCYL